MDGVARLAKNERSELFSETAAVKETTPAVVEKDFWVTWVLDRLFRDQELSRLLRFKGGTSLSKAYGLIERFSEDIDLILDWRKVTSEEPRAERSRSKQDKFNKTINAQAQEYIGGPLLDQLTEALGGLCECEQDGGDRHVLNISYTAAFADEYLRPEVRLEIGPLASWGPSEVMTISSYAAEAFPKVFARPSSDVHVIKAERTFWEKATILHAEAHRPADKVQPPRYSRHYYDLAKMALSPICDSALAELSLLADVVEFKKRFYPCSWACYDLAAPGSLRLIPREHVLESVKDDYAAMADMIFGEIPQFDRMMDVLSELQEQINAVQE